MIAVVLVPNIVCLTLIGSWYKKYLTKDYIWVHFFLLLLKSCKSKFKVDLRRMFQKVQGQEGQGWQLLASAPTTAAAAHEVWRPLQLLPGGCSGCQSRARGHAQGSDPRLLTSNLSLRQLSCQPSCTPASPGRARRDWPAQKEGWKQGQPSGLLDGLVHDWSLRSGRHGAFLELSLGLWFPKAETNGGSLSKKRCFYHKGLEVTSETQES